MKMSWYKELPIERELKKLGYYENYVEVIRNNEGDMLDCIYGKSEKRVVMIMPKGMNGMDLFNLRKSLQSEYKELEQGTGEIEVLKRGADTFQK